MNNPLPVTAAEVRRLAERMNMVLGSTGGYPQEWYDLYAAIDRLASFPAAQMHATTPSGTEGAKPVPLTEERIDDIWATVSSHNSGDAIDMHEFAWAIEREVWQANGIQTDPQGDSAATGGEG